MLAKILLVEDEKNVGGTLHERLLKEGFDAQWVTTANDARNASSLSRFHLVLMDVGLPDGSGFDVAHEIRQSSPSTALVFLTAWGTPEDRVRGLELGAEDYVVKPFHFKELLLRIQNILKRTQKMELSNEPKSEPFQIGKAKVWFSRFEIESEGQIEKLTHKECAFLKMLFDSKGKVLSRDEILNEIWGIEEFPSTRTIDNFIVKFRKWIEPNIEQPQLIKNIRGVGYQLGLKSGEQ